MATAEQLVKYVIKGIEEKKGQDIVVCDLSHLDGAVTHYFVICQGQSPTQVEAIAESVGDVCREEAGEKPVSAVGLGAAQWVALDYVDVMVHIFLPETRAYYNLEDLWADAKVTKISEQTA